LCFCPSEKQRKCKYTHYYHQLQSNSSELILLKWMKKD